MHACKQTAAAAQWAQSAHIQMMGTYVWIGGKEEGQQGRSGNDEINEQEHCLCSARGGRTN